MKYRVFLFLIFAATFGGFFLASVRAAEVIPPSPSPDYIVDQANVLSPRTLDRIDRQLEDFERTSSNQLVVAIYPKMQSGDNINAYAQRIAESWKIGQKKNNNGVLLLIFTQDRKMTIQVGYGLEGALPDMIAKLIIDQDIAPHFKSGNYDAGVQAGVDAIIAATQGEYKGNGNVNGSGNTVLNQAEIIALLVVGFIIFSFIGSLVRRGTYYSSNGGSLIWFLLGMIFNSSGDSLYGHVGIIRRSR